MGSCVKVAGGLVDFKPTTTMLVPDVTLTCCQFVSYFRVALNVASFSMSCPLTANSGFIILVWDGCRTGVSKSSLNPVQA